MSNQNSIYGHTNAGNTDGNDLRFKNFDLRFEEQKEIFLIFTF